MIHIVTYMVSGEGEQLDLQHNLHLSKDGHTIKGLCACQDFSFYLLSCVPPACYSVDLITAAR